MTGQMPAAGAQEGATGAPDRRGLHMEGVSLRHGDGTAAKLLNDPALYTRLDSMTTTLNRILTDFESNPGRYLREMKLIEIF